MTDKYAVIGNPISHSKSPEIHAMFAAQFKGKPAGDISYEAIPADRNGFKEKIDELRAKGYKGCNVTVPFKFEAFKYAQLNLSDRAQVAKAVNTLKFNDETVLGDNTDGAGLVADIERNFCFLLQGKRTLLMGAGGAAWGVALPLMEKGTHITIVNRTEDKAFELAVFLQRSIFTNHTVQRNTPTFSKGYSELAGQQFDVVINATSAGLTDSEIPLPSGIFAPGALAYDMMYGRETPFMKFARANGAAVVADGLGMLVEQAAEAFYIWRGVRPDTAPVIAALRAP